jgi:hypothetical protein
MSSLQLGFGTLLKSIQLAISLRTTPGKSTPRQERGVRPTGIVTIPIARMVKGLQAEMRVWKKGTYNLPPSPPRMCHSTIIHSITMTKYRNELLSASSPFAMVIMKSYTVVYTHTISRSIRTWGAKPVQCCFVMERNE